MTQGLQARLKFANRGGMGWLRHKIYLARLWTGAYMLDHWEQTLFLFLAIFLIYLALSTLMAPSPLSPEIIITTTQQHHGDRVERE